LLRFTRNFSGKPVRRLNQDELLKINKFRLSKIVGEAALIFVSVFIAIWLESEWQNRADETEAMVALSQLLAELRADQEFEEQVRLDQMAFVETTEKILLWLENSESLPQESVQETVDEFTTPLTIWPRRAAWTTMVASGQLALIDDKSLVARLGDLYEYRLRRLIYNGEGYDSSVEEIGLQFIPEIWDFRRHELLTSDYERIAAFHGKVRWVNEWAHWYLNSLADYNKALNELIVDVEKYLQNHGAATGVSSRSS